MFVLFLVAIVLCVLQFVTSDYLFDIFKLLAIVLSVLQTLGHCIVCSSNSWPLYCLFFKLLAIVLCSSNSWPLYCLFFNLRLLITPLVSSNFPSFYGFPYEFLISSTTKHLLQLYSFLQNNTLYNTLYHNVMLG
jgi:hypothetical protein